MEHLDDNHGQGAPMVRIDGRAARRRREELGLTQLYVATAVGVTTDTISRWENRRSPSIKRDNALRLAEALEMPLEALQPAEAAEGETATGRRPSRPLVLLLAVLAAALAGGAAWWLARGPAHGRIVAERRLPPHAAPGAAFPVLLRLQVERPGDYSLILRERLPAGCTLLRADPPPTSTAADGRELVWIFPANRPRLTFGYVARLAPGIPMGSRLAFSGRVNYRGGMARGRHETGGTAALEVRPLHWADLDGNHVIDDQEILTVYDVLAPATKLDIGLKEIEALWAASGYRWNEDRKEFEGED
ncbi:helix-turn-helix transcriptional regulator [Dissulfurirhabdus thermomarina]|uniref:Helix-turn-helix transcriptional regulator n=1 Tax=Dissulfurirhabdus thermomarina TaxID=1765737 RepID=A0A6N9TP68_DISTH|nr:helix-turn-helix transcriptional regulator [Dissulfurirhabdus thermomarina]NDY42959.1 helix-turn-helix transcriptional regulator [Dissulfurirhabdus thermomarina]NMX24327.1 helix-turn-helix transcriptional regulator [Dissulfurirhabdus thermomarina]